VVDWSGTSNRKRKKTEEELKEGKARRLGPNIEKSSPLTSLEEK